VGSKPANLTAGPVAAGSTVSLRWTLWPTSHSGPVITYMAKCPAAGCQTYLPGTAYVTFQPRSSTFSSGSAIISSSKINTPIVPYGLKSLKLDVSVAAVSGAIRRS